MALEKITGKKRAGLVLLHPTSLPEPQDAAYGVGELGSEAFRFLDFLKEAGVLAWQILPYGHTGYGDSPYQTFSRYAGTPFVVSVEKLLEAGDLRREDHDRYVEKVRDEEPAEDRTPYGWLFEHKLGSHSESDAVLRRAFGGMEKRGQDDPRRKAMDTFVKEHRGPDGSGWLADYSDYMGIKENHGQQAWSQWPAPFRDIQEWRGKAGELRRENPALDRSIRFYDYVQFCFFSQWGELKNRARELGRLIIGDLPWYVGYDSADVWANPAVFDLDEEKRPRHVAGVPPDYFSPTGQLWGNPLYDWSRPATRDWWVDATAFLLDQVDVVRLDHFRAIDTFWKISRETAEREHTALNGCWEKGPAQDLLEALQERAVNPEGPPPHQLALVAEDLGHLDPLYARPEGYPKEWGQEKKFPVSENFRRKMEQQDPALGPAFNPETGEYSSRRGVDVLLEAFGLPYMAVAQFGFEGAENQHPEKCPQECVLYTATHDNDTALGWYQERMSQRIEEARQHRREQMATEMQKAREELERAQHEMAEARKQMEAAEQKLRGAEKRMKQLEDDADHGEIKDLLGKVVPLGQALPPSRDIPWEIIDATLKSDSALAGAPMQDLMGLGSEGRMNQPGSEAGGWWSWRAKRSELDYAALAQRLKALNEKHRREG